MEKLPGIQLSAVQNSMEIEDRFALTTAIARYQKAWMSVAFNQFGSLYWPEDLDGSTQSLSYINQHNITVTEPRFAVGPSTKWDFSDYGRSNIECDSGPCKCCGQHLPPM